MSMEEKSIIQWPFASIDFSSLAISTAPYPQGLIPQHLAPRLND